jgi:hypothetical protein
MQERRSKRRIIGLDVEVTLKGHNYQGHILNVSENGIFLYIDYAKAIMDFIPGMRFEIESPLPTGDKLNLRCELKWLYMCKNPAYGYITNIGTKIVNPPLKYREFVKTLH